jgi:hypothetical protein
VLRDVLGVKLENAGCPVTSVEIKDVLGLNPPPKTGAGDAAGAATSWENRPTAFDGPGVTAGAVAELPKRLFVAGSAGDAALLNRLLVEAGASDGAALWKRLLVWGGAGVEVEAPKMFGYSIAEVELDGAGVELSGPLTAVRALAADQF